VPPFALRLTLGRDLVDVALLASQRVRPAVLEGAGFSFRHPEIASALSAVLGS
jgi:NAD dependent epimerase/dehydratase family enzyme